MRNQFVAGFRQFIRTFHVETDGNKFLPAGEHATPLLYCFVSLFHLLQSLGYHRHTTRQIRIWVSVSDTFVFWFRQFGSLLALLTYIAFWLWNRNQWRLLFIRGFVGHSIVPNWSLYNGTYGRGLLSSREMSDREPLPFRRLHFFGLPVQEQWSPLSLLLIPECVCHSSSRIVAVDKIN